LIRLHKGELTVESKQNGITEFTITLKKESPPQYIPLTLGQKA